MEKEEHMIVGYSTTENSIGMQDLLDLIEIHMKVWFVANGNTE